MAAAGLRLTELKVEVGGHPQRHLVGRSNLQSGQAFLQRLSILSLLLVDAREQQPRLNGIWVGLHPFFANDHRLHEAAGRQVGLGQRTVRIRGWIGGESVLELCELGGARRFRWGVGHAEAETLLLHSTLRPVKGAKVRLPRSLDTEFGVGYPTVAPKSFKHQAVIAGV